MTTGDEPQLGGRGDDLSPMISGRGTKIIVSARGAYTVGNLVALLELMTEEQLLAFKQAAIRQILSVFRGEIVAHAETQNFHLMDFLSDITHWLDNPTTEYQQVVKGYLAYLESADFLEYGLQYLISATQSNSDVKQLPAFIRKLTFENYSIQNYDHRNVLWQVVAEWQLEVAWSIINAKSLPAYPAVDSVSLTMLLNNPIWGYQTGHLWFLVRLFTKDHWHQFHLAVQQQALWYIDHYPSTQMLPQDHIWIREVHRWHAHAVAGTKASRKKTKQEARNMRIAGQISTAVHDLVQVFDAASEDPYDYDCAQFAYSLAKSIALATHSEGRSEEISRQAQQWQFEAAWAILHNQPIPPLE